MDTSLTALDLDLDLLSSLFSEQGSPRQIDFIPEDVHTILDELHMQSKLEMEIGARLHEPSMSDRERDIKLACLILQISYLFWFQATDKLTCMLSFDDDDRLDIQALDEAARVDFVRAHVTQCKDFMIYITGKDDSDLFNVKEFNNWIWEILRFDNGFKHIVLKQYEVDWRGIIVDPTVIDCRLEEDSSRAVQIIKYLFAKYCLLVGV